MKRFLRAGTLVALAASVACGRTSPSAADGDIPDRDTFVATYVDLRASTVRAEGMVLPDAQRAEILARHGVTEDQLMGFARVHGQDVEFMRAVWDEVEARMDAERVLPDGDAP